MTYAETMLDSVELPWKTMGSDINVSAYTNPTVATTTSRRVDQSDARRRHGNGGEKWNDNSQQALPIWTPA